MFCSRALNQLPPAGQVYLCTWCAYLCLIWVVLIITVSNVRLPFLVRRVMVTVVTVVRGVHFSWRLKQCIINCIPSVMVWSLCRISSLFRWITAASAAPYQRRIALCSDEFTLYNLICPTTGDRQLIRPRTNIAMITARHHPSRQYGCMLVHFVRLHILLRVITTEQESVLYYSTTCVIYTTWSTTGIEHTEPHPPCIAAACNQRLAPSAHALMVVLRDQVTAGGTLYIALSLPVCLSLALRTINHDIIKTLVLATNSCSSQWKYWEGYIWLAIFRMVRVKSSAI